MRQLRKYFLPGLLALCFLQSFFVPAHPNNTNHTEIIIPSWKGKDAPGYSSGAMDFGTGHHGGGGGSTPMSLVIVVGTGPSKLAQTSGAATNSDQGNGSPLSRSLLDLVMSLGSSVQTGASGNPPPPEDENNTGQAYELEIMTALLKEAEQLMESLEGEVVLVVDKDNTILPDDPHQQVRLRLLFREFVERWQARGKLKLVMVTRGQIRLAIRIPYLNETLLPQPDYIISIPFLSAYSAYGIHIHSREGVPLTGILPEYFLGSGITLHPGGVSFLNYAQTYSEIFENIESRMRTVLGHDDLPEGVVYLVENQWLHCRVFFRLDYSLQANEATLRQAVLQIAGRLALVSFDFAEGVMTIKAAESKGEFVAALAEVMGLHGQVVIVAGDSIDDFSMMDPRETGIQDSRAVVVGNADGKLSFSARNQLQQAVISSYNCLLGTFDGFVQHLRALVSCPGQPSHQHR